MLSASVVGVARPYDQPPGALSPSGGDGNALHWNWNNSADVSFCACSAVCGRTVDLRGPSGNCGQAVEEEGCEFEKLEGFAVLERNEVYRADDIVYCASFDRGCFRARLDSRTILCEAPYRKTLLRQMLRRTTSIDGAPLQSTGSVECESLTATISEPEPGFSFGRFPYAAKMAEATTEGQVEQSLAGRQSTLAMGDSAAHIAALTDLIKELPDDFCEPAADDELVMPIRLGDFLPTTPEDLLDVTKQAIAQYSGGESALRSVVFSGVMHYGHNTMMVSDEGDTKFSRTEATDQVNVQFLTDLRTVLDESLGLNYTFRSEPILDVDLCYLTRSKNVAIAAARDQTSGGTFSALVAELRLAVSPGAWSPSLILRHVYIKNLLARKLLRRHGGAASAAILAPRRAPAQEMPRQRDRRRAEMRQHVNRTRWVRNWARKQEGADDSVLPSLVVEYGRSRTATTLQYQTLCASMLLLHAKEKGRVRCLFMGCAQGLNEVTGACEVPLDPETKDLDAMAADPDHVSVVKIHYRPPQGFPKDAWLFTTANNSDAADDDDDNQYQWENAALEAAREYDHDVRYVQMMNRAIKRGAGIASDYQMILGLSDRQVDDVLTYLRSWDVLRMCCGLQMDESWRAKLQGADPPSGDGAQFAKCETYDIDLVERNLVQSHVFQLAQEAGEGAMHLRSTSSKEAELGMELTGSYCSWFNRQVACQNLRFNEVPGPDKECP